MGILTMASLPIVSAMDIKNDSVQIQEFFDSTVQVDVIYEADISQEVDNDQNFDKTINLVLIFLYAGFLLIAIIVSIFHMKVKEFRQSRSRIDSEDESDDRPPSYKQIFSKSSRQNITKFKTWLLIFLDLH